MHDAGRLRRAPHLQRLRPVRGQRLVAQDMQAGAERAQRHGVMEIVGVATTRASSPPRSIISS